MVCTKFWTDSKVKQLTHLEKLIFLYLISNPHTHLSGIYYLPLSLASEELGITVKWPAIFERFAQLELAYYDDEQRLVWVCRMYGYQGKGENIAKSVARHLQSFHPSVLIKKFISAYNFINPLLSSEFIKRVGEGVGYPLERGSITIPIPSSILNLNLKTEKPKNLTDEEWLSSLRNNPAYAHVNFDHELGKMEAWLLLPQNRARKRTKRFILNWINNIDPPVANLNSNKPVQKRKLVL